MNQTRWAMVGTGLMLELIGKDLMLTENVDARVIVSRTQARADEAAAQHGFPEASGDFDAVLERDDIDVVYVATPHALHFDQATAALRAGKHVLVEKSMTTSAALTTELCNFAKAQGLFCMEAMWTAFNPAIRELRRRIEAGDLGEINLVHANFGTAVPYNADHRLWAKELAGGSMLDQGVYTCSFAHMILGTPSTIQAHGTVIEQVDAEVIATLGYASGAKAVATSSLRTTTPLNAFVGGSLGHVEIPGAFWNASEFTYRQGPNFPGTPSDTFTYQREGNGYIPMLRAVSEAIMQGTTEHPLRTHAETIAVAATMDEVLHQVLR